jgi:single-strand DNA-binding protein
VSRSLNKVMLIGNLGADPEVRSTNNGSRVATLSLATSRQWTTQGGEKQEKTEWHRCVVWNRRQTGLADVVEKYLKKGDRVYVEGRIEYRTWQDREGQTRYTTEINVSDLVMLSGRGDGGGGAEGGGGRRATSSAAPSATAGTAGASAAKAGAESGKADSFADFPEALDEEDDDLPF